MTYEELLKASDDLGLVTKEKPLQAYDGRIKGRRIAIRRDIPTQRGKACVLAEELGHYFTSTGDLFILEPVTAAKQERKARIWAYNLQIGLSGLVEAKRAGCRNAHETADFLDVPLSFLTDCIDRYKEIYGSETKYRGYLIIFDPHLDVITKQEAARYAW